VKRVCIKCREVKPFSEFHKNKRTSTGVHNVCKPCHNLASEKRYREQGARLRALMAEQRKNDYEKRVEIERRSRLKNKERYRPRKNERQRARNRVTQDKKFLILDKELARLYYNPCYICGSNENQSIDHLIPLSKGGRHSIGNLITLCLKCNTSKGNKFLSVWIRTRVS
jgi:hypothetical protein